MTAQIENVPVATTWEQDIIDSLGWGTLGNDADMHTVEVEGNILGVGELWQRLGSDKGPVMSTKSVAVGYSSPGAEAGYTFSEIDDHYYTEWGDWR